VLSLREALVRSLVSWQPSTFSGLGSFSGGVPCIAQDLCSGTRCTLGRIHASWEVVYTGWESWHLGVIVRCLSFPQEVLPPSQTCFHSPACQGAGVE
jgi:hypothetical protein